MQPALTWIDLTSADRDRMRRVWDLFREQGTRDEMGLGSLRDALSEALFPGTSYVHTRLRYVLFIPWIYRRLEDRRTRAADVEWNARRHEIRLIGPLERNLDNEGIIGVRSRAALDRLPSSVYWNALVRWGLFTRGQSQGWYHAHFEALADGRGAPGRADDPGVVWSREPHWHPRLPAPPEAFPREASFALTREEAEFLRGRLEEQCSGALLAWLATNGGTAPAAHAWSDPDALSAPAGPHQTLELARRFSLHVEGMPLLYNLLVAERRHEDLDEDESAIIEEYRAEIAEWAAREAAEDQPFEPHALWDLLVRSGRRLPEPRFIESWSRRIGELDPKAVADDHRLRVLVRNRELRLKGPRARLVNDSRLLAWRPGVGVGRMDFRWTRVRQLLIDLHRGLEA